jgi:uncharacterized protein (TIGR02598 family)
MNGPTHPGISAPDSMPSVLLRSGRLPSHSKQKKARRRQARAFSLVEVVLALGVTSFVLMALVGTLPAGVKSVKDSMNDSARANILQEIRAELEEVSFGSSSSASDNIDSTLTAQTNYYSPEGLLLTPTGSGVPTGSYYQATFAPTNAVIPGTGSSPTYFQYESAQSIAVIISYPVSAPSTSQKEMTNYLFAAKQKNY